MKAVFGVLSLLIVVAVIGILARKQLGVQAGGTSATDTPADVSLPINTPQQGRQMQDQFKKSLDNAMQQPRPKGDGQ